MSSSPASPPTGTPTAAGGGSRAPGTASRDQSPRRAQLVSPRPRPPRPRGHAPARPPPGSARPRGPGLQHLHPRVGGSAAWRRRGPAPRLRLSLAHIALGELAPPSALLPRPPATAASASPAPRRSHSAQPQTRKLGALWLGPPFADARAAPPPPLPHSGSASSPSQPEAGTPGATAPPLPATPEGGRASLFRRRVHGPLPSPPECHPHPRRAFPPPRGVHPDQVAAGAF